MDEKSSQAQWETHVRDEEQARREQQRDAGPTHEPVGESVGERLQAGISSGVVEERERCAKVAARWSEASRFRDVTGPLGAEAEHAVQRVVRAIEAEIREKPLP